MKKNNAFTLTELIAVIVIIGVVLLITIPAINGVFSNNDNKTKEIREEMIRKAIRVYADTEKRGESCIEINPAELNQKEYLDNKVFNELTGTEKSNKYYYKRATDEFVSSCS